MQILENTNLAPYTSLNCGGPAEKLIICENYDEHLEALKSTGGKIWNLGFGTNSLISDKGLPGTVIMTRVGKIEVKGNRIIVDAGAWWDDVVLRSIEHNLWDLQLLSGIPSSTGSAVVGNIAAYGQQISDCLESVEVFDTETKKVHHITAKEIDFNYRSSSLQEQSNLVISRVIFKLSDNSSLQLQYESALKVAKELSLPTDKLADIRKIILETRRRAGSLYDPNDADHEHTAGSFFKNPTTDIETAKKIAEFDETGKSLDRILKQNKIHGGDEARVSAAHVLLAAGFKRGQTWGNVRLHPKHVLKIENTGGASAQEIYEVAKIITSTVLEKLKIELEPEVKFIGDFT